MKELLTESITAQIQKTLSSINGTEAAFGKPIKLDGKDIIPVASVRLRLAAASEGKGGGDIGSKAESGTSNLGLAGLGGGGGGNAQSGIDIEVTPVGFITDNGGSPIFHRIS